MDVFGRCGKHINGKSPECRRGSAECDERLKGYKFRLGFENSFCRDYISEKYRATVLAEKFVPIVMGGGDYKKLGMPNSYIDVNDFDTIEDLASYIKYLDGNDTAYNQFFEFRRQYKLGRPRSWSCKICKLINSPSLGRKVYEDLGGWYSIENPPCYV